MATYEVNANGNNSYKSDSARSVANVAASWRKSGLEPSAYVILDRDGGIVTVKVPVTTAAETRKALTAAATS